MPKVALVMHDTAMLYEAAIAAEVFGTDRADLSPSGQWYDFVVCTPDGAPHPWFQAMPSAGYNDLDRFDTVIVPSTADPDASPDPVLFEALAESYTLGARIASLCTGAFVLAAAGLLDGRAATTHWMHAADLASRYPSVDVLPDVLYLGEGQVLTSAGKTAALDLCLHLVRRDFGSAAANGLAKRLVVPSHRPGGQAQFITPPPAPLNTSGLGPTLEWAKHHLNRPLTVKDLAQHAGLSTRHLARRMHTELHTSPLSWLHQQRITRAEELLEQTDASIEQIAATCGMGTAATLRRHFRQATGTTPTAYRATFHS